MQRFMVSDDEYQGGDIYLDNAATSWPKPPAVMAAMEAYNEGVGASAGRGAYRRAVESGRLLFDTREVVARLFHIADSRRVIFTLNATEALNLALQGLLRPGDHVVTTSMEHNSVVRPLHHLARDRGVEFTQVPCSGEGFLDPDDFARALRPHTRLAAVIHASNVCGAVNDVAALGRICRERGVRFLVDAAQSAGAVPIDVQAMNIDLLAFPGHKSLLGPLGTGALYVGPGIELEPLVYGGTGTDSGNTYQPDALPDHYEAGSHNALGLAGLKAACEFIEQVTPAAAGTHKAALAKRLATATAGLAGVRYFGPADCSRQAGVCSFQVAGWDPSEVAVVLDREFGIMARAGLHCAPLAHKTLGTLTQGTVRFSFGWYNTEAHADAAAAALAAVAARRKGKHAV